MHSNQLHVFNTVSCLQLDQTPTVELHKSLYFHKVLRMLHSNSQTDNLSATRCHGRTKLTGLLYNLEAW